MGVLSIDNNSPPPGPEYEFDVHAAPEPLQSLYDFFHVYGDIYELRSSRYRNRIFVICHPEYLKYVLIDNRHNYKKGGGFDRVKMLLGNGIIVTDGDEWKRNRLMIQPAFHRDVIVAFFDRLQAISESTLGHWQHSADIDALIDVTNETSFAALRSVLSAIFNDDLGSLQDDNPFLLPAQEHARDLGFARRFRSLAKPVLEIIARRRSDTTRRVDILASLMAARDRGSGEPMSDKQLVDEVMTLIVAGHETTASTLNWAWYLLAENPGVARRLERQLDQVLGDVSLAPDTLKQIPYARQILEETMRLYPPVWRFTRRAIRDDEVGGYRIPAGSDLVLCPYITHRHPAFWDDVERFDPGRFEVERCRDRHRVAYLPFSAGPRRCIGDGFALLEMQIHLCTIARCLSLERADTAPVEMEPEINLRSRTNILMRAKRRRAP